MKSVSLRHSRSHLAVLLPLVFAAAAAAQTVPPAEAAQEETIRLSVFQVTTKKDVGYRAGTTLAGTRTGEEIKNVPQTITVMTGDFLKDIGATDAFGVMQYAIGGAYTPSSSFDVNSFLFRGIQNAYQSRNFFIWYNPSDGFSTDRIDVVRGPNAILFGDADPGGMMNLNTKRALFHDTTVVGLRVGSWNQKRGTLDHNQRLGQDLAIRLNLVYDDKDNWENWVGQRREGVHLAATWRPFKETEVRFEGEYSKLDRRVPQAIPLDQYSLWNDTAAFPFNASSAPAGTQRLSSATGANYWVWDQSVGALRNWRGFGQTGGLSEVESAAVKDPAIFGKGLHVFGPSYSHNFNYNTFTATVDQRIGEDLNLQLVANVTTDTNYRKQTTDNSIRRDPNLTLPGGAANPNYGKYYIEYSWDSRRAHHHIPEARFNIVYDWKPVAWMKQRVFASAGLRQEIFNNQVQREVILNNPTALAFNNQGLLVRRRVYLEGGDAVGNTGTIDPVNDAATGLQAGFLTTQNAAINTTYTGNAQLNASGEYLGGKFRTLLGVRRDYARSFSKTGFRDSNGLINRADAPELLRFEGYNTSITGGGLWQPSKNYTFFATAAESYRPTGFGNTLINGEPVGAQLGRGHEGGVRLDFAEGKFFVQASVFKARQSNSGINLNTTVATINSIWTNNAANAVRPDYAGNATTGGTFDREAIETTGHEIEAWCNLVPGWTLQVGYGYSDAETIETSSFTRDYIAQNLPAWKATAATNATTASALNPLIASLENFLATAVPGSKSIGASRHSFSLFTKYTVQGGAFKNFEAGTGLVHRSGPVVYNEYVAGAVSPAYSRNSTVLNLLLGYSRRLSSRLRWNVSLNIQNALDDEYYVELSRTQVTYGEPISWALTNTFSF